MNGDFYLGNRSNFGKGDFYISKGKFSIEKDIYEFLQEDNFNASPPKTFFTEIPREKTEMPKIPVIFRVTTRSTYQGQAG